MRTRVPADGRQGIGLERHHRAKQQAALEHARPEQHHRRRDVRAVRVAHRDHARRRRTCSARPPPSRSRRARRRGPSGPRRRTRPSASRRKKRGIPFSSTLPRGLSSAAPGASRPSGTMSCSSPPVPCSSSSVGAPGAVRRREDVIEAEIGHLASGSSRRRGASAAAARARSPARDGSNHGGSTSDSPRCAGSSSTANPGPSVAISNSTPPGSLK